MRDGTKNLTVIDLDKMQNNPCQKANEIGRRVPYYLQYIRDGKVNVKPEVKDEHGSNV